MKNLTQYIHQNIFKPVLFTIGLTLICFFFLFLFGKLHRETATLFASLNGMYSLPILIGNLMLLNNTESKNQSLLLRSLKSVSLSMAILFVMNFVLWVLVWGAPIQDLFTERNLIFYLIGFCLLAVIIPFFNFLYLKLNSNQPI